MHKKGWALISCILVGAAVIFTLSCGGGGGSSSGGTTGSTQAPATMDDDAAARTIGMAMVAGSMSDSTESVTGAFDAAAAGCGGFGGINIVRPVLAVIMHPRGGYQSLGGDNETVSCSTSGSMTVNIAWDGEDDYDDCDEISNVGGSITFNDCVSYHNEIKGTITFTSSGTGCRPVTISVTYTDFDITNSKEDIHIWTDSFTIDMKDFVYSGDELVGATMVLNGTINAVLDGKDYSVSCSNYIITMTISGDTVSMTISGMINGPCLDGWVSVETLDPILVKEGEACPVGGKIKLSGKGEVIVTFNGDGSVDVGSTHYDSCEDLNQGCR